MRGRPRVERCAFAPAIPATRMSESPAILLTNDDGIESVGFRALYDALSEAADVTAV
ncbi:MAG: 5'/3'-nucleotidase SurE, partial [Salinigranum sp.]